MSYDLLTALLDRGWRGPDEKSERALVWLAPGARLDVVFDAVRGECETVALSPDHAPFHADFCPVTPAAAEYLTAAYFARVNPPRPLDTTPVTLTLSAAAARCLRGAAAKGRDPALRRRERASDRAPPSGLDLNLARADALDEALAALTRALTRVSGEEPELRATGD